MSRDLLALTKPRITVMAVIVAAAAAALAPGVAPEWRILVSLLGVGLIVAAANALNQYLEREGDALMTRTADRPLPAGRLHPRAGLAFGLGLAAASLPLLALAANPLTVLLAAIALANYVGIYTPMKRRSTWALQVGAISGAMPVLMGWTMVTGRLDGAGLLLFAVMLAWQVPHFLAISLYRKDEYVRAGILVVPAVHGDDVARRACVAWTTGMLPLAVAAAALGQAGALGIATAALTGLGFLGLAVQGLSKAADDRWARQFFAASLVYPLALLGGLLLDVALQ